MYAVLKEPRRMTGSPAIQSAGLVAVPRETWRLLRARHFIFMLEEREQIVITLPMAVGMAEATEEVQLQAAVVLEVMQAGVAVLRTFVFRVPHLGTVLLLQEAEAVQDAIIVMDPVSLAAAAAAAV